MKYEPEDWENYHKGIHLFNREKFFEAHEAWEEVWKRAPDEEDKRFLQGLIQAAAFLVHVQKKEGDPPVELHDKSSEKLETFQEGYWGIDIRKFLESLRLVRETVGRKESVQAFPKIEFLKKPEEKRIWTREVPNIGTDPS